MTHGSKILLETGTNEFELIEFIIAGESYGINVAKIREVIEMKDDIYPVPKTHPCLKGVTNIRNEIISIIDLSKFLGIEVDKENIKEKIIITEFNNLKMGFVVDSVTRIYRLSWEKVTAPDNTVSAKNSYLTSIVRLEDKILLMLDFERIVMEINQYNSDGGFKNKLSHDERRNKHLIVIAEDSNTIRSIMVSNLEGAGYRVIQTSNGIEAMEKIKAHTNDLSLVITDIEMPQMDGYSLCKNVKDDHALAHIPVIIYSSLITPEIKKKGESVGATAQLAKPELEHLLYLVDEYLLHQRHHSQ